LIARYVMPKVNALNDRRQGSYDYVTGNHSGSRSSRTPPCRPKPTATP